MNKIEKNKKNIMCYIRNTRVVLQKSCLLEKPFV